MALMVSGCSTLFPATHDYLTHERAQSSGDSPRYQVGDSVQTMIDTNLQVEPEVYDAGNRRPEVPRNTLLYVEETAEGGDFVRFTHDGFSGWLRWATLRSMEEVRKRREQEARVQEELRQRRARAAARFQALRDQGLGLLISTLSEGKDSADGITVYVAGRNIEQEKTIKYITFAFRLFNRVGDPARGRIRTPSGTTIRGVGPIAPGDSFGYTFDNVWYSSTGDCVELRLVHVEYVDGSTSTYANRLEPITQYSQRGVNLEGDCQTL